LKTYTQLVADILPQIDEVFPWDLEDINLNDCETLFLDIREASEFSVVHIEASINVPRGILESACDWGYDDTVPELALSREKPVIVICRSGNRSALAAWVMQTLGYQKVKSLKTGLRGWNDADQPLVDNEGNAVDADDADEFFRNKPTTEQLMPS